MVDGHLKTLIEGIKATKMGRGVAPMKAAPREIFMASNRSLSGLEYYDIDNGEKLSHLV
jgi:hypothetical protein